MRKTEESFLKRKFTAGAMASLVEVVVYQSKKPDLIDLVSGHLFRKGIGICC